MIIKKSHWLQPEHSLLLLLRKSCKKSECVRLFIHRVSAGSSPMGQKEKKKEKRNRDTDEDVSRTPTCWDSDVVRLLGSNSVGDVGTLPLESDINRVLRSRAVFSHFVTLNLRHDQK